MQRDRVDPGLSAPSSVVVNSAAPLSESVRTTVPDCQELPALSVEAVKAAEVDCHTTVALTTTPTGTAAASTVRSVGGCMVSTGSPRLRCPRTSVRDMSPSGTTACPRRGRTAASPVRVRKEGLSRMVELRGLEPLTLTLPGRDDTLAQVSHRARTGAQLRFR